jgi:hypothetical protein
VFVSTDGVGGEESVGHWNRFSLGETETVVRKSWSPMVEGLNRLLPKEIRSRQ